MFGNYMATLISYVSQSMGKTDSCGDLKKYINLF